MQYGAIDDVFYFHFAANDTSGSGADGATPLFDVRLCGAAGNAAPVQSGTPTLLSHANFPDGCHEIAITASVANGYSANNKYAVFCTIAVSSQNPSGFVGAFATNPVHAQIADGHLTAAKFAADFFTAAAAAVWNALTSGISTVGSIGKWILDKLDVVVSTRAAPGAQMDLVNAPNATARSAIAASVEAAILNEADATALLAAISAKVEEFLINEGDATATLAAIAAAVRTNLSTELGRIDASVSSRLATVGYTAPLTSQQTRDALKLAASGGAAAAGSIDQKLDDVPTVEEIDTELSDNHGDGSWEGAGGGGEVEFVVNVLGSVINSGEISEGIYTAYVHSPGAVAIPVVDQDGNPLELPDDDLTFVVEKKKGGGDVFTKTTEDGITVGGVDDNVATITFTAEDVATPGSYVYSLRTTSTEKVWAHGQWKVSRAARVDPEP